MVAMRATHRFGNNPVDYAKFEQVLRRDFHRRRRFLGFR